MTQDAIVTKRLPDGMAEVVVTRTTACGSNCGNCESCIFQSELKTPARNLIDAKAGQRVVIESRSSKIYKAAMLVYIVPVLLMLGLYALASVLGAREGLCIAASFAGLLLGAVLIVWSDRRKKQSEIGFDIIAFNEN